MSREGNCLDNAVVESFFGTLKSECFDINELETSYGHLWCMGIRGRWRILLISVSMTVSKRWCVTVFCLSDVFRPASVISASK